MNPKPCFHCGEPIITPVLFQEKEFCCSGCSTVFQIIQGAGLNNFYDLAEHPGINQKNKTYFDYLDSPEVVDKIIQYQDKQRVVVKFVLPDVHCVSCVWLLERIHQLNKGIISSTLDFIQKKIIIHFNPSQISLREVAELLQKIGYTPEIIVENKVLKNNTSLVIKIGIAGFCFGNIMLLSFPEYLSEFKDLQWKNFFSYLSIFLIIPVITYCSMVFYKAVYTAFLAKKLSIDIPIVLGIVALLGRSLYDIFYLNEAGYLDTLAGLIFFLLLGKWFQSKVFGELSFERNAGNYLPMAVLLKVQNDFEITPLEKIKTGDVIKIRSEEILPFDGLLASEKASINTSFITGEELPIVVSKNDLVYCGSKIIGAASEFVVKDVKKSNLEELWKNHSVKNSIGEAKVSDLLIKYFTLTLLLIAVVTFIFWSFSDWDKAFLATTAVLIIACPCALALVTPTVYGLALRKLSTRHIFLKNTGVIQSLQKIKNIIFDKTGTLTSNEYQIEWKGEVLSDQEKIHLYNISQQSVHPLAKIIIAYFAKYKDKVEINSFQENPGIGIQSKIKNMVYYLGTADFVGSNFEDDSSGYTRIYLKINESIRGYFKIRLSGRQNLNPLFQELKKSHDLYLLSGDKNLNPKDYENWIPLSHIIKGLDPKDKSEQLDFLNQNGHSLMIGDGINDTLAFEKSTVGLAVVEENGAFFPACDGIIKGEKLQELHQLILFAKSCKQTTWICFGFSLIYNVIGLSFAVSLKLTPLFAAVFMPISSVSVVSIAILVLNFKFKRIFLSSTFSKER